MKMLNVIIADYYSVKLSFICLRNSNSVLSFL